MDFSEMKFTERAYGGLREDRDSSETAHELAGRGFVSWQSTPSRIPVTVGVDLGQLQDATAIAIVEQETRDSTLHHNVRMLTRIPLGTPYTAVADRLVEIVGNLESLSGERIATGKPGFTITIVCDAGGVGRPAIDVMIERGLTPIGVVTTGGDVLREREDGRGWNVGKSLLVSSLLMLIQSNRISLPTGHDSEALVQELRDFRVDQSRSGNDLYGARSSAHDDMVSALSLAVLPGIELRKPKARFIGAAVAKQKQVGGVR